MQVSTNVVVDIRPERTSEPLSAFAPLHPPDAVQAVALDADQARVVLPPFATLLGAAVRLTDGGGGDTGGETDTVTDCEAVAPPLPLQVSVNVVVVVRPVLASEPLSAFAPVQPPDAVQLLALDVDQLRVDVPPFATVVGDAASEIVGDGGALGGVTVTVTDCDAVPPAPVQDSVYVVVEVRPDFASEPESALLPVHPPEAVQLAALVTDQLSVVPPPLGTVDGVALSVNEGSGGAAGGTTVTFTDCVAVPPAPEQVRANDEFAVSGPVEALPEFALLPLQLPDAAQDVAFVDDHVSVAAPPASTVEGTAERETEGPWGADGGAVTLAVTVWPAVPPEPLQVSVYDVVAASAPVDSAPVRLLAPLQPPDASHADAFEDVQWRLAAALCWTVSGATVRATLGGAGGVGAGLGTAGAGVDSGASAEPPPEHPTRNREVQSATALRRASVLNPGRSIETALPRITLPNVRR